VLACAFLTLCSIPGTLGCRGSRATASECAQVLDKIVDLELSERGFRDPELARRKRDELRRALGSELAECTGKPIGTGALACVQRATSTEQVSHECLR
jgi:hypothetical protein